MRYTDKTVIIVKYHFFICAMFILTKKMHKTTLIVLVKESRILFVSKNFNSGVIFKKPLLQKFT